MKMRRATKLQILFDRTDIDHGMTGRSKQDGIKYARTIQRKSVELCWRSEHHMHVIDGKKLFELRGEP
jgi:hypothetical protein